MTLLLSSFSDGGLSSRPILDALVAVPFLRNWLLQADTTQMELQMSISYQFARKIKQLLTHS